jgi:exodeoxyribonuclease-3
MKILSWNVNGLRAAYKKGFLDWFSGVRPDILCLQEVRAQIKQLPQEIIEPLHYHSYFNPAQKKGYAGVAVYTKKKPQKVERGIGMKRFDGEGRILRIKYPSFSLINLYIPHGGRKKEFLDYKLEVYDYLLNYLKKLKKEKVLVVGDFNIAHKEIDLARPKQNKQNIMFTLKERAQIDKIIKLGFVDTFRKFHRQGGHYTWWVNFANARQRNLGWRIDYIFASKALVPEARNAFILSEVMGSDHCPIGAEFF